MCEKLKKTLKTILFAAFNLYSNYFGSANYEKNRLSGGGGVGDAVLSVQKFTDISEKSAVSTFKV